VKQTLKQLEINERDPNFIAAATELKSNSKKKLGEIFLIIFLFIVGLFFLGAFIYMIPITINSYLSGQSFGDYFWMTFGFILFYPMAGLIAFFTLGMAFYWFKEKPDWYIGLYTDRLIFHQYNEAEKSYDKNTVSISAIQQCTLLKTEHVNYLMIKGAARETVHYTISVHIEYESDAGIEHIHLLRPDGFAQLNELITFLQNEKQIPIYYTYAPGEMYNYERRDERELLKQFEQKPIVFSGQLEDFTEKEFTRRINHFEALEISEEYIKRQGNKRQKK